MKVTAEGQVRLLTLDEQTMVLNDDSLGAWDDALDRIEGIDGPLAIVVTGTWKSFHQGLDLPFLQGLGDDSALFLQRVHRLFGRLLRLDVPTVAAINGHAQAAGAMLSTCMDLRVMRADRGWFRLPEIELNLPFATVMNALLQARLPQPAQHQLMVLGVPMGGAQAAAAGVVDEAVQGAEDCVQVAIERPEALAAYRGPVLRQIRTTLYADVLVSIDADAQRADRFAR